MRRILGILLAGAAASVQGWSATTLFVFPAAGCTMTDRGYSGNYPLWRNVLTDHGDTYAQFGYTSFQATDVTIPEGNNNIFVQDPQFRNQPTVYHPGVHQNVFGTTFDPWIGLSWFLNGGGTGGGSFATADASLPGCPGMSVNADPLPPQFAPIGLASGQTVRLTVFPIRGNNNCTGTLSFADANGNPIGPSASTINIWTGQNAHLDLVGSSVTTAGHRIPIQPRFVSTGYDSCRTGVEVFATATGVTAATNRPIQPSYQYDFDPQGLSAGQTLRVNVSASAVQSCGAAVRFVDGSGNTLGGTLTVTLNAGASAYLDLPSTSVPGLTGWSGGHVAVQPILDTVATGNGTATVGKVVNGALLADETCFATAEIFDTATGYTRSLVNPQPVK